jgi:integrase
MGRKRKVWYRDSEGAYYTTIDGKQVQLAKGPQDETSGPTYLAALTRFRELDELKHAPTAGLCNRLRTVCEAYLEMSRYLNSLCDRFGMLRLNELLPDHIDQWIAEASAPRTDAKTGRVDQWEATTQRIALATVSAALNYAVERRMIPYNPLGRQRRPRARSRGAEAIIGRTPEQRSANHARILAAAPPSLRPLIIVLEATGARPGELCEATAEHFDAKEGCLLFHARSRQHGGMAGHKTDECDKERIIMLEGKALDVVKERAERYPNGPLFRHRMRAGSREAGQMVGWTQNAVSKAFEAIREKTGIPALTAYSYRHTFATVCLLAGMPVEILATLMGNTPKVIHDHYAHLLIDRAALRRHLAAARGAEPTERADTPFAPRVFDASQRDAG